MADLTHATLGAETGIAETAESEVQTRPLTGEGDAANEWLCTWCLN